MSISNEITRLENAKNDIKLAIENKGVVVSEETKLDGYSTLIEQIETGGSTQINEQLPQPVTGVTTDYVDDTTIRVSWENPDDTVNKISNDVAWAENVIPTFPLDQSKIVQTIGTATSVTIEGLTIGNTYGFFVMPKSTSGLRQTCKTDENSTSTVFMGNGVYIAGDYNGNIYHSTDGRSWVFKTQILEGLQIRQILYAQNKFICVGYLNNYVYVYYSTNGITWTQALSYDDEIPKYGGYRLAFGNGMFLLATDMLIYKSTDGITWTQIKRNLSLYTKSLVFGNGVFVLVSGSTTKIQYSTDGTTWTNSNIDGQYTEGVSFCNDRFIISNSTKGGYYSFDGINWNAPAETQYLYGKIWYGNGIYLAKSTSGKLVFKSTDGVTWTYYKTPNLNSTVTDMVFAKGQFVAVDVNGTYYSVDDLTWTPMTGIESGTDVDAVCYGNI